MPRAAACSECGELVWITSQGTCANCSAAIDPSEIYRALAHCPGVPLCKPSRRRDIDSGVLVEAQAAVDDAWFDLVRARSIVPYLDSGGEAKLGYVTPGFYRTYHVNPARVTFERPLSSDDLDRIRTAGHSINEGQVLRLHAILDAAGVLQEILTQDDVVESHVLVLKNLRNELAHGRRRCAPDNAGQQKLLAEMLDLFYAHPMGRLLKSERAAIDQDLDSGQPFFWPLSISGVLKPLHSAVWEYLGRFIPQSEGSA